MKNKTLTILFVLTAFNLFGQYTDLKEYGLKGEVKRITTRYYKNVMYKDGEWVPIADEEFNYLSVIHFNKQGNIDTANTSLLTSEPLVTNTLIYEFKAEKKVSGKYYDEFLRLNELYSFSWLNPYTYTLVTKDTNGIITFESTSWLDKNYRDSVGEYKIYEEGKLVSHERYTDIFDSEKRLIRADYIDVIGNKKHSVLYKQREYDEFGNSTITLQLNITNGHVVNLSIRHIEYY